MSDALRLCEQTPLSLCEADDADTMQRTFPLHKSHPTRTRASKLNRNVVGVFFWLLLAFYLFNIFPPVFRTITVEVPVDEADMTEYLYGQSKHFDILENLNNPKETMQYLIPFTSMVS